MSSSSKIISDGEQLKVESSSQKYVDFDSNKAEKLCTELSSIDLTKNHIYSKDERQINESDFTESSTQPNQKDKFFYNEAETQVTVNCKTSSDGLSLIIEKSFVESFDSHEKANVIILNVESELKNVETLRENELNSKSWILVVFLSTTNERQMVITWRNNNSNVFQKLEFDEKFSKEFLSFVLDFIIEILEKEKELYIDLNDEGDTNYVLRFLQNASGLNLLMEAIQKGKNEIFNELLDLSFTLHEKYICNDEDEELTAADFAWKANNQEILLTLLQKNSPFPTAFEEDEKEFEKASEVIKLFIKDMNEMHKAVGENNEEKVTLYLVGYENLRYFYDIKNKSIATLALELKNIEMYQFLHINNCRIGKIEENSNFYDIYKDDKEALKKIRDINLNFMISFKEKYLWFLFDKSVVAHDEQNVDSFKNLMMELFEIINESDDGKIILQIAATCKKIKIIFDFDRSTVHFVNPYNTSSGTRGLFSPSIMKIFVGAKILRNFQNEQKSLQNAEQKLKYSKNEIAACLKHELAHMSLYLTFRNGSKPYDAENISDKENFQEIVRIYGNLNYRSKEKIIESVFEYKVEHYHAELIVRVPQLKTHYKDNFDELNIMKKENFIKLFEYYEKFVMPKMKETLKVLQKLQNDDIKIFYNELTNPLKIAIKNSLVKFQGIEIKFKDFVNDKVLLHLESNQLKKVLDGQILDICENQKKIEISFYKERKFIDFEFEENSYDLTETAEENSKDFEQILTEIGDSKIFLLSDHAGAGKSTSIKILRNRIKEKFPQNFVEYVDLKRHLKVFKEFEENKTEILKILLDILEICDNFEVEIFRNLFNSGRVVLLFDGVDEIAPNYNKQFLELVKNIDEISENQIWIATRPQHTQELEENLCLRSYKFLPFNKNQAKEFIDDYMKSQNFTGDSTNALSALKIFNLHENLLMLKMIADLAINGKLSKNYTNKTEIYEDFIEMKREILSYDKGPISNYDRDKSKKITIWEIHQIYALELVLRNNKYGNGFFYTGPNFNYDKLINFNEFQLFKRFKREKFEWSPESISRFGFLVVENWNTDKEFPDFSHRTFADFFVAEFIFDLMKEVIEIADDELSDKEIITRMNFSLYLFRDFCAERDDFEILTEFLKDFSPKFSLPENCSEKFTKFMQQKNVGEFFENTVFHSNYPEKVFQILKFSYSNEQFFKILNLSHNEHKNFFQIFLSVDEIIFGSCCELLDVYKNSKFKNWHKLTGFGEETSNEEFERKFDDETLHFEDFLETEEISEDYEEVDGNYKVLSRDIVRYFEDEKEDFEILKLIDQFLSFLIIIDDFKIKNFTDSMKKFLNEFLFFILRSKKLTKKFCKMVKKYFEDLEIFKFLLNKICDFIELFHNLDVSDKYVENYILIFKNIEEILILKNFDKENLRKILSENFTKFIFLIFSNFYKIGFMKDLYEKNFTSEELCGLLGKIDFAKICKYKYTNDENIQSFLELCKNFCRFPNAFQLLFNHIDNFYNFFLFLNFYSYKNTGYKKISSSGNLSKEKLTEIANEIFPENIDIDHIGISEVEYFVKLYEILCFINDYEIPIKHIENFFKNSLNEIFGFAFLCDFSIIDKIFDSFEKLKLNPNFSEILLNSLKNVLFYHFELKENEIKLTKNLKYFCQKSANVKNVLKNFCVKIDHDKLNLLVLAINLNLENILEFYHENFKQEEILEIIFDSYHQIYDLNNDENQVFAFVTFKPEIFDNYFQKFFNFDEFNAINFLVFKNFYSETCHDLKSKIEIIFKILNLILKIEISHEILENFFVLNFEHVLFRYGLHSSLFIEILFKIFKKYFVNKKLKIAKWIENVFEITEFFNDFENNSIQYETVLKIFWFHALEFFISD